MDRPGQVHIRARSQGPADLHAQGQGGHPTADNVYGRRLDPGPPARPQELLTVGLCACLHHPRLAVRDEALQGPGLREVRPREGRHHPGRGDEDGDGEPQVRRPQQARPLQHLRRRALAHGAEVLGRRHVRYAVRTEVDGRARHGARRPGHGEAATERCLPASASSSSSERRPKAKGPARAARGPSFVDPLLAAIRDCRTAGAA